MRPCRLRFFFDSGSGVCLWAGDAFTEDRYGLAVEAGALPCRLTWWPRPSA